jgi:hypothetical protein
MRKLHPGLIAASLAIALASFPAMAAYQPKVLPVSSGGTGASTLAGANIPVTNAANTWTGAAQIFGAGINHNGGTFQLNGTKFTQIGNGFFTSYGQNLRFRTNDNGTPFDSVFETGNVSITNGSLTLAAAGNELKVKEGSNAALGVATLVAGTVTVSNTLVTASSRIFLTSQADGGTPGWVRVSGRTAATSFTITSSSGTDTSTVAWHIIEPAP